jgi:hypothetical protein
MIWLTDQELAEVAEKTSRALHRLRWADADTAQEHLEDAVSRSAERAAVIDRLIAALDDALTGREDMRSIHYALLCDAEEYGLLRFE